MFHSISSLTLFNRCLSFHKIHRMAIYKKCVMEVCVDATCNVRRLTMLRQRSRLHNTATRSIPPPVAVGGERRRCVVARLRRPSPGSSLVSQAWASAAEAVARKQPSAAWHLARLPPPPVSDTSVAESRRDRICPDKAYRSVGPPGPLQQARRSRRARLASQARPAASIVTSHVEQTSFDGELH